MTQDPRLAVARNLVRIYRDVLEEPIPMALVTLLARLEADERLEMSRAGGRP
jgi:anti-sigma factor NepR-like protein